MSGVGKWAGTSIRIDEDSILSAARVIAERRGLSVAGWDVRDPDGKTYEIVLKSDINAVWFRIANARVCQVEDLLAAGWTAVPIDVRTAVDAAPVSPDPDAINSAFPPSGFVCRR